MTTKIFTIGTSGKNAEEFFETLKNNNIDLVLDIRLNNNSQLLGFAKGGQGNLGYLLNLLKIKYIHDVTFAPTDAILDDYHKSLNWDRYVERFEKLVRERRMKKHFQQNYSQYKNVCLLCTEKTDEKCHRRLVAEAMRSKKEIIHL